MVIPLSVAVVTAPSKFGGVINANCLVNAIALGPALCAITSIPSSLLAFTTSENKDMTKTEQLKIDYPATIPDALQQTREQFKQEAKWAMAVKLFEMKRLSSGMAAQLVGTERVSFLLISIPNRDSYTTSVPTCTVTHGCIRAVQTAITYIVMK